jgi:hypothetical protein
MWYWDTDHYSHREWFFGLVKLTNDDEVEALMNHMLNRHGMAPMMIARHNSQVSTPSVRPDEKKVAVKNNGGSIDISIALTGNPGLSSAGRAENLTSSKEDYEQFVRRQWMHPAVHDLKRLLSQLSLEGIRKLHSYDHEWSVIEGEKRKVPGCGRFTPTGCILQAGWSDRTYTYLMQQPFDSELIKSILVDSDNLQDIVYGRVDDKGYTEASQFGALEKWKAFRCNYMRPEHTHYDLIDSDEADFRSPRIVIEGGINVMKGKYFWEAGGVSCIDIPISDENTKFIMQDSCSYTTLMGKVVEQWLQETVKPHKQWFRQNKMKYWMGEQGEFLNMCRESNKLKVAETDAEDIPIGTQRQKEMWFSDGYVD